MTHISTEATNISQQYLLEMNNKHESLITLVNYQNASDIKTVNVN